MREVREGDIVRVRLDANMAQQVNDFKNRSSFVCFRTDIIGVEHPGGGWVPARGTPLRYVRPEEADNCLIDKIKDEIADLKTWTAHGRPIEPPDAAKFAIEVLESLLVAEKPQPDPNQLNLPIEG